MFLQQSVSNNIAVTVVCTTTLLGVLVCVRVARVCVAVVKPVIPTTWNRNNGTPDRSTSLPLTQFRVQLHSCRLAEYSAHYQLPIALSGCCTSLVHLVRRKEEEAFQTIVLAKSCTLASQRNLNTTISDLLLCSEYTISILPLRTIEIRAL